MSSRNFIQNSLFNDLDCTTSNKEYLNINIPDVATKQLKLQNCSAGRKLVISTNWLPLFDFEYGSKVVEELIAPNKGMRIRLANESDNKTKKVYKREYKSRKNNPLKTKIETQFDIRSQKLIDDAFPEETQMVHITFRKGVVEIKPIINKVYEAIQRFRKLRNPLITTLACSSGIDGYSLQNNEFVIDTLIEYRPHEKRDKGKDLTETGALNALANLNVNTLINEDIMNLDLDKIAELTNSSNNTLYHVCLQCDDFTPVKANSLKNKSVDDGSTTLDMVFDALSYISKFSPPTILVENVRGFKTSDSGKMLISRLKRLGYKISDDILDARDFGGLTQRVRYYLVASLLPFDFEMPKGENRNTTPIWDEYIEPYIQSGEARDVSDTKFVEEGLASGRIRLIKRDSISSPTYLKSQDRMAKDSVAILDEKRDNRYFIPSPKMMARLMGIPKSIDFRNTTKTIESEVIGQSIEYPMHDQIIKKLKEHILLAHAKLNNR